LAATHKTVVFHVDILAVVEGFTECGGFLIVSGVRVEVFGFHLLSVHCEVVPERCVEDGVGA